MANDTLRVLREVLVDVARLGKPFCMSGDVAGDADCKEAIDVNDTTPLKPLGWLCVDPRGKALGWYLDQADEYWILATAPGEAQDYETLFDLSPADAWYVFVEESYLPDAVASDVIAHIDHVVSGKYRDAIESWYHDETADKPLLLV